MRLQYRGHLFRNVSSQVSSHFLAASDITYFCSIYQAKFKQVPLEPNIKKSFIAANDFMYLTFGRFSNSLGLELSVIHQLFCFFVLELCTDWGVLAEWLMCPDAAPKARVQSLHLACTTSKHTGFRIPPAAIHQKPLHNLNINIKGLSIIQMSQLM